MLACVISQHCASSITYIISMVQDIIELISANLKNSLYFINIRRLIKAFPMTQVYFFHTDSTQEIYDVSRNKK